MSLSEVLRDRTRGAHERAEAAFSLERRLLSRDTYADLLARLHGLHGPMEGSLRAWQAHAGTPDLGVTSWSRAHLLVLDLTDLDEGPDDHGRDARAPLPSAPPTGLPQALGWLYVLEGSALGGRLVARAAQSALGAAVPVAFFTGAGLPALGGRWRALRQRLDGFGLLAGDEAVEEVVDAADEAFGRVEAALLGGVATR